MTLIQRRTLLLHTLSLGLLVVSGSRAADGPLPRVRLAEDRRSFVLGDSGQTFVPWGFNYDHDEQGRLLEDYWTTEWAKVDADFREMRQLGANVVRVHLQLGRFMDGPAHANADALKQLTRLIALAEGLGVYLDLTGLGCYHKRDVPPWYDALGESDRWAVQTRFWEAVAQCGATSPAIFCYDLMNEPVVPGGERLPGAWLGPEFAGSSFVQFITLNQAGRPREKIAVEWIRTLTAGIRRHDRQRLITVGLVPWSLERPGLTSGFPPEKIAADVDFIAVHLYPERAKIDGALKTLTGFAVGKPVVLEETAPLTCTPQELDQFLERSQKIAPGCIGFYWGKTSEECRRSTAVEDRLMAGWLEVFQKHRPAARP